MVKAAKAILNDLGFTDSELSIAVIDDVEMQRLNREYRGIDQTTDVLSFSLTEGEFGEIEPQLLGDVIISAPTAAQMSRQHQCPFATVLDVLLIHGILHLAGFDHATPEEAEQMDRKTLELLALLDHPATDLHWFATTNE